MSAHLPRRSGDAPIAGALPWTPNFANDWEATLLAIEAALDQLTATEAALQAQVDRLTGVLDGTIPFSQINADGTGVIDFLNKTDGSQITDHTALAQGTTAQGALLNISPAQHLTSGTVVDVTGGAKAVTTVGGAVTINGNMSITSDNVNGYILVFKVTRTGGSLGTFTDTRNILVSAAFAGAPYDVAFYFEDDQVGDNPGTYTYTYSFGYTNSGGVGFGITMNTLRATHLELKQATIT